MNIYSALACYLRDAALFNVSTPPVRSTNCLAPSNDHSPLEDTANNYSSSSVAFFRRLECLRTILGANLQSQICKGQKPCAQVSRCDLACFRTVRDGPLE